MLNIESKLPTTTSSIFSVISKLATSHEAINLGQGYPNFDCPDELKELVKKYLDGGKNQYAAMPGVFELRSILAKKINKLYSNNVDAEAEITITAGATQAIFTTITAFIKPGDEVVVFDPSYDCYRPSVELNGGIVVNYNLTAPDFQINWNKFQSLISPKTKMIIVNTPHNPLGTCFKASDWLALQEIVRDTNIIILSDEVYEHLVYDNQSHESVLKYTKLFPRAVAVYSFGKTFHNTGWKMGYCVADKNIMSEFRKVHQFNVFSVNSFVQYGIAEYLNNEEHYLQLSSFYQAKRDLFHEIMKESRFKPLRCEGSYFQIYDYSAISDLDDLPFVKKLVADIGIATIPVSAFYSDLRQQSLIRFCFAKTNELLEEAGKRLIKY